MWLANTLLYHATILCVHTHYVSHADNHENHVTKHAMYTCMLTNITCAIAALHHAGMALNLHKTSNQMLTTLPNDAEDIDKEQGVVTTVTAVSCCCTKLLKPSCKVQDLQTVQRSKVNGWLVHRSMIQMIRLYTIYQHLW